MARWLKRGASRTLPLGRFGTPLRFDVPVVLCILPRLQLKIGAPSDRSPRDRAGQPGECCGVAADVPSAPPAQIRAGPIQAPGSHLGCLTADRTFGHGCRIRGFGRNSSASPAVRSHFSRPRWLRRRSCGTDVRRHDSGTLLSPGCSSARRDNDVSRADLREQSPGLRNRPVPLSSQPLLDLPQLRPHAVASIALRRWRPTRSSRVGRAKFLQSGTIPGTLLCGPAMERRPALTGRLHAASGLSQVRSGNRAKSPSVEHMVSPCSMASAARCASGMRFP